MLTPRLDSHQPNSTAQMVMPWHLVSHYFLCFINFHIPLLFLPLTLIFLPAQGVSYDFTDDPGRKGINLSDIIVSLTGLVSPVPYNNTTRDTTTIFIRKRNFLIERTVADGSEVPRDSPTALVIASSIAAVCILVFFVIAYLWHTHQLDSRARKLAIRLAADAEHGMQCRSSRPQMSRRYPEVSVREKPPGISESSQEQSQYAVLTPDDERGAGSDGGRSSVGVSEGDAGDNEDAFDLMKLPTIGDSRNGTRNGRSDHRKWNRSRKSYSGANLDKRDSAVTDKEVLTHFASRRHSTFFI